MYSNIDEKQKEEMYSDPVFQRNKRWYQISQQVPDSMMAMNNMGPSVANTYWCLVKCSNRTGACIISKRTIAKAIGVSSIMTVYRAINKLMKNRCLAVVDLGIRRNLYILNPALVWRKSAQSKYSFAKIFNFPVNMVIPSTNKGFQSIRKHLNFAVNHSSRNIDFNEAHAEALGNTYYNLDHEYSISIKRHRQLKKQAKLRAMKNNLKKKEAKNRKYQAYQKKINQQIAEVKRLKSNLKKMKQTDKKNDAKQLLRLHH